MNIATIDAVKAAGFRVYMRHINDSWLYFTSQDGSQIGYLQEARFGGYGLSTAHIPNKDSGTGYQVYRDWSGPLTAENLSKAFAVIPPGFYGPAPTKWKSWDAFAKSNSFNAEYKEI